MKRNIKAFLLMMIFCIAFTGRVSAQMSMENNAMGISIPLGANLDEDMYELCPGGMNVIGMFMAVWKTGNYEAMYELLDDESKEGYSVEEAKFDFQFLEFKPYVVSAVRKRGGNFEFFLSSGDWKTGDKELIKMLISGKTNKIIMPERGVLFKKSVESYF